MQEHLENEQGSIIFKHLHDFEEKKNFKEEEKSKMNGVHCVSLPAPSLSHLMYAMEVVDCPYHRHRHHYIPPHVSHGGI